jgi:hypothetical protein
LKQFEKKIYSQNGEDGVIEKIFQLNPPTNKFFVEFGVEDGEECNTRYLESCLGFKGVRFDCNYENKEKCIYAEFINANNVTSVFSKYNVPVDLDFLSIDVDYNDFYIWKSVLKKYRPNVVVIEYNSNFGLDDKIVEYDENGMWDWTDYFGASITSLCKLGNENGYDLIFADSNGVNLFFLKNGLIPNVVFLNKNNCKELFVHNRAGCHRKNHLKKEFSSYDKECKRNSY